MALNEDTSFIPSPPFVHGICCDLDGTGSSMPCCSAILLPDSERTFDDIVDVGTAMAMLAKPRFANRIVSTSGLASHKAANLRVKVGG